MWSDVIFPKNSKYKWTFLKETAFQPYTSNKELHSADNIYPTPANVDMEESAHMEFTDDKTDTTTDVPYVRADIPEDVPNIIYDPPTTSSQTGPYRESKEVYSATDHNEEVLPTYEETQPPPNDSTTLNTQPTPQATRIRRHTTYRDHHAKPPTYIGFSIFNILCCFWPAGLGGLYYASKVSTYYNEGRYEKAEAASAKALKANVAGVVLGIITLIVSIPAFVVFAVRMQGV